MTTIFNRTSILQLTNKSGGALAKGAVVIVDTANASSVTTIATERILNGIIGVVVDETIANNSAGAIAFGGWVPKINLISSASLGDFVITYSGAGLGTPVTSIGFVPSGSFGQVLQTGTNPECLLFGVPHRK